MNKQLAKMTVKEIADKLNSFKLKYGFSGTDQGNFDSMVSEAKKNGIVIALGLSDDILMLEGSLHEEFGANNGRKIVIDSKGVIENRCSSSPCPYFKEKISKAKHYVEAVWCPEDKDVSWEIKSNIPHETFTIMEDGEIFCIGIVFKFKDELSI